MNNQKNEGKVSFPERATEIWVILTLTLFPLIMTDYYFNILQTKVITYHVITTVWFVVLLGWGITSGAMAAALKRWKEEKKLLGTGAWLKKHFLLPDWCMLVFTVVSVISTLLASPYIEQAVTGVEGRYNGLLMTLTYAGAYFCMRRFYRFRKRDVTAFLLVSAVICLMGLPDFYNLDLFGFKFGISEEDYRIFTSTIGNINTFTVYCGFVVSASAALFIFSEEGFGKRIFYAAILIISYAALIVGRSDNGYLTLLGIWGILPFLVLRDKKWVSRYLFTLAMFFTVMFFIWSELRANGSRITYVDGVLELFSGMKKFPLLVLAMWIIASAFFLFTEFGKSGRELPSVLSKAWAGMLGLGVIIVAGLLISANTMDPKTAGEKFGSVAHYFIFSDSWGTNRGYVWRALLDEYRTLPFYQQLFGSGPDTFGIYMLIHRYDEMVQKTGQVFDSAHNEYLQYFFTLGPIGLVSYIGLLVSGAVEGIRTGLKTIAGKTETVPKELGAYLFCCAFLIIGYAVQAVVNISVPITTCVYMTFLMMAAAAAGEVKKEENERSETAPKKGKKA